MDHRYEYKFFSTSHTSVLENVENSFEIDMTDRNLFLMRMSKFPDENFMFSEPTVKKLVEWMGQNKHVFTLLLSLTIIEDEGGESTV